MGQVGHPWPEFLPRVAGEIPPPVVGCLRQKTNSVLLELDLRRQLPQLLVEEGSTTRVAVPLGPADHPGVGPQLEALQDNP